MQWILAKSRQVRHGNWSDPVVVQGALVGGLESSMTLEIILLFCILVLFCKLFFFSSDDAITHRFILISISASFLATCVVIYIMS